jgi:hypothetical protein
MLMLLDVPNNQRQSNHDYNPDDSPDDSHRDRSYDCRAAVPAAPAASDNNLLQEQNLQVWKQGQRHRGASQQLDTRNWHARAPLRELHQSQMRCQTIRSVMLLRQRHYVFD